MKMFHPQVTNSVIDCVFLNQLRLWFWLDKVIIIHCFITIFSFLLCLDNVYSESGNVLPPTQQTNYWNSEEPVWDPTVASQAWLGPNARPKETFEYGHNPSQGESFVASNAAQTYDYNHRGSDNFFDQVY